MNKNNDQGYPMESHPMQGLIIPAREIRVFNLGNNKRRDKFLVVYPEALSKLDAFQLETFLNLLLLADYNNRANVRISDLVKLFKITYRATQERVYSLRRSNGFIGRTPLMFLNPFYGSKCSASYLDQLRKEWLDLKFQESTDDT